ncbi:hypothetical protein GCK72_013614 [Caenorhabditis remanei]|uniref:Uncharacterized protein n=1 Tax=Caenorhabditis remanei TaxID=31234 RepID=A0A6A5GRQ9_CAERE|nr:hypothetical protein GCK72_013614 [Caenorhabditis remanei]KAF1757159.1 hypothetical protein GCK72_013614 [Caenorhabditis remanei]
MSTVYTVAAFIGALALSVFLFIFLWIKDTQRLKREVIELKKKVQDLEEYRMMRPYMPLNCVIPMKPDKKEKKIDEFEAKKEKEIPVFPNVKTLKKEKPKESVKKTLKKSVMKSAKKSKTIETSEDCTKSDETKSAAFESPSAEQESKTTKSSVATLDLAKTQEKSPIEDVATAELHVASKRRY